MTLLNCSALFRARPPDTTLGAEERSGREEMVSSSERCLVASMIVIRRGIEKSVESRLDERPRARERERRREWVRYRALTCRIDGVDLDDLCPVLHPCGRLVKRRRPDGDDPDPILVFTRGDLQDGVSRVDRAFEGRLLGGSLGVLQADDIGDHAHVERTGEAGEEVFVDSGVCREEVGGFVGPIEELCQDRGDGCKGGELSGLEFRVDLLCRDETADSPSARP